jgi:hypothetical protein
MRQQQLKKLLLKNIYRAPNLQAEITRLEQIEWWLQELETLLGLNRQQTVDWVFEKETA